MRVLFRNYYEILLFFVFLTGSVVAQSGVQKTPPKQPPAASAKSKSEPVKTEAVEESIPPVAPNALFPAVVARVNGKAILGRDLEQRIQSELSSIGSPAWKNLREDYRQQLVSENLGPLIANELIYQEAVAGGIKATDAEVAAEFDKLAKNFSGDAEMNKQLADRGMDRASLNRELARSLVVSKFIEANIAKKTEVSPADAQQYYSSHTEEFRHPDLVRTSHILILVPDDATADQDRIARQRAQALLQRVKRGEDFAKLAKENSMDGSASQGGDIGFAPKGQLAPEYEEAAFALPVGGVSDLVRTQFGYHIIKVTEKKKEGLSTFEDISAQLIDFLKNQKTDEQVNKYVGDLRAKAKIEVLIPVGQSRNP